MTDEQVKAWMDEQRRQNAADTDYGKYAMTEVMTSFDGACEPYNPGGHMGMGWVINGVANHRYIPDAVTNSNNVAEYMALIGILKWAKEQLGPAKLTIQGDSQLVIYQLSGEYAVRSESIRYHYEEAASLIADLRTKGWGVNLRWVSRECNAVADAASKQALVENGVLPARRSPDAGWTDRLGDVAKQLDISAAALGKLITQAGWRNGTGVPTPSALERGIAQQRFNGYGLTTDWQIERLTAAIRGTQNEALSAAKEAQARKDNRVFRRRAEEEAKEEARRAEQARIAAYRPEIERLVVQEGASLYDAVELAVADIADRPAAYEHRSGWWRERATSGLSTKIPENVERIESIKATLERELGLLRRRAGAYSDAPISA
jgi:ribonuclease HI